MISEQEFGKLRLRAFYTKWDCGDANTDIEEAQEWEFLDRVWVGEIWGFTQWLRLKSSPDVLRCMSLDLSSLPKSVTTDVLKTLGLPLEQGMDYKELLKLLGKPKSVSHFLPDRETYEFEYGNRDRYSIECTVTKDSGLSYIVVHPSPLPE
jgi:hypothetical protein